MSTVIQFTPRAVSTRSRMPGSTASAAVIRLPDAKPVCRPVKSNSGTRNMVDTFGNERELMWVTPLEQDFLQALFRGREAAAEFLLERADVNPAWLFRKEGSSLLWTSKREADFFDYMQKAGLRAAAARLLEQEAADAPLRAARHAELVRYAVEELKAQGQHRAARAIAERHMPAKEAKPAQKKVITIAASGIEHVTAAAPSKRRTIRQRGVREKGILNE
jgi:hypothetical protein